MKQKELLEKYPNKTFGMINIRRDCDLVNRWDNNIPFKEMEVTDSGWEIYLEHSCDEWIIGGLEDAKKFKNDLEEALEYLAKMI